MNIKDALIEEVDEKLNCLCMMNVESEEYKNAVESITKLADRIIEIEKIEAEKEIKLKAQEDEKHDRFVKNCSSIGMFLGSTIVYGVGTIISINFERFGTFTTKAGQGSIKELLKLRY